MAAVKVGSARPRAGAARSLVPPRADSHDRGVHVVLRVAEVLAACALVLWAWSRAVDAAERREGPGPPAA